MKRIVAVIALGMLPACGDGSNSSTGVNTGSGSGGTAGTGGAEGRSDASAGSDAGKAGGTDASASGDAGGALDASGDCNNLFNSAPRVSDTYPMTAFPSPQGGEILDGTYYLTKVEVYPGGQTDSPGTTHKTTLTISHTSPSTFVMEMTAEVSGVDQHFSYTGEISGTSIILTGTCPPADPFANGYSANGVQLALILDGPRWVNTSTKQ